MQNEGVMHSPAYKIPESVLVVIYTIEAEVLLIRRADAGTWQSVTGSKDFEQESWQQTASREVMEETGLLATHPQHELTDWAIENFYEIYPAWRHRYAPHVSHNKERVFGLKLPRRMPIQLSPAEHTAYKWLSWKDAADTCCCPTGFKASDEN